MDFKTQIESADSLIGKRAPDFIARSTKGEISMSAYEGWWQSRCCLMGGRTLCKAWLYPPAFPSPLWSWLCVMPVDRAETWKTQNISHKIAAHIMKIWLWLSFHLPLESYGLAHKMYGQTVASLIVFLLRFLRPSDFFALAGLEQLLVTHVLHRYGLGIWIG